MMRVRSLHLTVCFIVLLGPAVGETDHKKEWKARAELHESSSPSSPVKTLVTRSPPFQLPAVDSGSLLGKQRDSLGRMAAESFGLQGRHLFRFPGEDKLYLSPRHCVLDLRSAVDLGGSLLSKLQLDSLGQDREFIDKMKHPFYRDRIYQLHRRWGPVYGLWTRFFYVKGVRLAGLCHRRLQINLAKRRIFYKDVFGELWPEDLMRQLVRARTGLLGSEVLFAKGQQYYLEVALVF